MVATLDTHEMAKENQDITGSEKQTSVKRMTRKEVLAAVASGSNLEEINRTTGYPLLFLEAWVGDVSAGKDKSKPLKRKNKTETRNLAIAEKYLINNVSMNEVGERYHISRQRVYQILSKFGIERGLSGAARDRAQKAMAEKRLKEEKYSVSREQLRELRKLGLTRRRSAINALYARKKQDGALSLFDMYALFSPLFKPLVQEGKTSDEITKILSQYSICRKEKLEPLSLENTALVKTRVAKDSCETDSTEETPSGLVTLQEVRGILFPADTEATQKRKLKILRELDEPKFLAPQICVWRRSYWDRAGVEGFAAAHDLSALIAKGRKALSKVKNDEKV